MNTNNLIKTINNAKEGDKLAVAELYSKTYNDIYYFALSTVKDPTVAEDILQEVAIEMINHISDLKEPEGFKSWILTITYRKCMKHFNKAKKEVVNEDEVDDFLENCGNQTQEFIPGADLDSEELKSTILEMINTLSEEQRSATLMYYFNEMSIREIASVQDVPEGTVKSRLSGARKQIKICVEKYEETNGVRLYSVGTLPLMAWFFKSYAEGTVMSQASAATTATVVAETVGVPVSSVTTTSTAATNYSMLSGKVATSSKIAKFSSLTLATKIIIFSVIIATIIIGALLVSQPSEEGTLNAVPEEVAAPVSATGDLIINLNPVDSTELSDSWLKEIPVKLTKEDGTVYEQNIDNNTYSIYALNVGTYQLEISNEVSDFSYPETVSVDASSPSEISVDVDSKYTLQIDKGGEPFEFVVLGDPALESKTFSSDGEPLYYGVAPGDAFSIQDSETGEVYVVVIEEGQYDSHVVLGEGIL